MNSDQELCVLEGGPFDGEIRAALRPRIVIPHLPPGFDPCQEVALPPYRWWHRLLRRPVPLPSDLPSFSDAVYHRTAERWNGWVIYRHKEEKEK